MQFSLSCYASDATWLSKNESYAIKGILIFLIVLGHNSFVTSAINGFQQFLYCFHVQCFFILPFFYQTLRKSSIGDYFVRLYYPFAIIFIIYTIMFEALSTYLPESPNLLTFDPDYYNIWNWILSLFTGNWFTVEFFCGFQYLWFLPVMFACMVIKYVYDKSSAAPRFLLLVTGLVCYILFFVFQYNAPYNLELNFKMLQFSPFALFQGAGAFFLAVMTVLVIKYAKQIKFGKYAAPILFGLCLSIYIYIHNQYAVWVLRFIMPTLFFYLLYCYRQSISHSEILKCLGKYSMPIYIIHPILCKLLFAITPHYIAENWGGVVASQIVLVAMSYYAAVLAYKIRFVKRFIFPSSTNELLGKASN